MPKSGFVWGLGGGAVVLACIWGLFAGIGAYTLHYGEGLSYFSVDPAACTNCHIMQPQFDSWQKASHHTFATCVDCHLPHDFVGKYIAKAENGYLHSRAFTLQNFAEPIRITAKNSRILQQNCIDCHAQSIHDGAFVSDASGPVPCIHCHLAVGHGPRAGLGSPLTDGE